MYQDNEINNALLSQAINVDKPGPTTVGVEKAQQKAAEVPNIDMAYLRQFSGGDIEFEKEIIQSSMDEIEDKMALLQAALQNNSVGAIGDISHSLKSLCSIIGSTRHYQLYKTVETLCAQMSVSETEVFCKEATDGWPAVKAHLLQYMQQ